MMGWRDVSIGELREEELRKPTAAYSCDRPVVKAIEDR